MNDANKKHYIFQFSHHFETPEKSPGFTVYFLLVSVLVLYMFFFCGINVFKLKKDEYAQNNA